MVNLIPAVWVALMMLVAVPGWCQTDTGTILPPGDKGLAESFRKADRNHDGALTADEAKKGGFDLSESFAEVDVDHSGTVTLFEIGEALHRKVGEWTSADSDSD